MFLKGEMEGSHWRGIKEVIRKGWDFWRKKSYFFDSLVYDCSFMCI
jgi:hypothetical protein